MLSKVEKEHVRDSNIIKIRTDPFFLGEGESTSEEIFNAYLAGVLNVSLEEIEVRFTKQKLKKVRHFALHRNCMNASFKVWLMFMQMRYDLRGNYLHAAAGAVRIAVSSSYGESDPGSLGKQEIVNDATYRDKDGKRMHDERFQSCLLAWYMSIRRVETRIAKDFQDISKLEFSQEELALVDMEVCIAGYSIFHIAYDIA